VVLALAELRLPRVLGLPAALAVLELVAEAAGVARQARLPVSAEPAAAVSLG
jgi:hypothetical protein